MKPLKIGVACFSTFGGSGIVATALGQAMAARGHHVHFVAEAPPRRLDLTRPNLWFHPLPEGALPSPGHPFGLAATLAAVHRDVGLDLIHAHYALPHAAAAVLASQLGRPVPVLTTLHGTDVTHLAHDPVWQPLLRHCLAGSAAVTAPSRFLAAEAERLLGPQRAIEVVPDFVDPAVFHPPKPADSRGFSDEIVLVHVSNFRPVKRVEAVVEVFARVEARRPARLLLIGDGPDRAAAEAAVARHDVGRQVQFLGRMHDFAALLRTCHAFLLPSASESFGLAALEALASGVPVIASKVGGLPEVVRDGETGWLLPPDDLAGMAARVLELGDGQRRRVMGEAARRDVLDRFVEGPLVDRYEALYRGVAGSGSRSGS